ncbi:tol-pal system-associated acyl-CoA thioesterase [Alcaligenaceae bacterium A4P071]|nr:tol-pal system-associated acyl-CoA thioesterase [Alcaligenaceae bacterium B3P038]MDQ2150792.1 tol-pal system-associated acyl-CoA thioesterase [Alcaligenaceae bacterium C4P045]MDQ2187849.1 tol-pal system-associated acyl-CoA thioesterase [Alcaligenaceae bacterium A4P071]
MPTEMPAEALFDIRVYYEDTDAGGVVYYANYLKFLERARTEWLRELGVFQSELRAATQRIFVVNALDMAYRKPARLDDRLTIHSRITRLGRASIHFAQAARRDGELLAEGTIQVCCVDAVSLRPAEIPPEVLSILKSIQE